MRLLATCFHSASIGWSGLPQAQSCCILGSSLFLCLLTAFLLLNGEELQYGFPLTFILPINGLLDSQ